MFRLVEDNTYRHKCTLYVPQGDGSAKHKITAAFKYIGQSRIEELVTTNDSDILDEVLAGWSGFLDAEGKEITYDPENRKQFLDTPYLRAGLVAAFFDSISGNQDRLKN